MYGLGLFKGLGVTLKHFIRTYLEDIRWLGRRYTNPAAFPIRQGVGARGAFTVQYPEEKLAVPERFRFIPFLVVNDPDDQEAPDKIWCTACGVCAKNCPPQCIWIKRGKVQDPKTGKKATVPVEFYIDIDLCMNCGICAEVCPFDAIKMDHYYELANYDRFANHILDLERLKKPISYWEQIAPTIAEEERKAREAKAAAKKKR